MLKGVNVLVITSGHSVTDHRIYGKLTCSLKRMGANVILVGYLERGVLDDVEVIEVPKPSSRFVRFLWQPWRCLWKSRNFHPDIVHFHDAEMLMTLPIAKLFWPRCKFVYDVHEDFANLMLVRDWFPSWLKGIVCNLTELVEKRLASLVDAIVGVTPPLTQKFKSRHKITAYNFVSQEFFEQSELFSKTSQERDFDLVHLGTLNSRRAEFLVATLQEYHKLRRNGLSLVLGCSDEIIEEIKPILPENCKIMGRVPHHEICKLLGNAKVGLDIHPWLGPHLKVALPVKVCEYMASGCAVVSSSMPVLDKIVAKAEHNLKFIRIIEGGDPIDYANAMAHFVETIEKGKDPARELREFAFRSMVWEKEAEKIAILYLRLLGRACDI